MTSEEKELIKELIKAVKEVGFNIESLREEFEMLNIQGLRVSQEFNAEEN